MDLILKSLKSNRIVDRRSFIQSLASATAVTALAMTGCNKHPDVSQDNRPTQTHEVPEDGMEYRTSSRGDRVSLLGYGCMRWPSKRGKFAASENEIDQEEVNRLVDYAIAHGVNFFDTSPVYCKGFSEEATGIALSRHPRESYLVSTKLSNFSPATWSREKSMEMYYNSFKNLKVNYIDYYLLHSIGGGQDAWDRFSKRYLENGMLDFLLEERKAGRIRHLGFSYHGDVRIFDWALAHHDLYHWDMVLIQMNYVDWHFAKQINTDNTNAEYLYGELQKHNIPAMVMEPLLGGQLSKLPNHASRRLKEMDRSRSVSSWAFRFVGSFPGVMTALSGMTVMDHLQDNLRSFCHFQPLDAEQMQILEQIAEEYAQFQIIPCTTCQYCMPCPYGIDIPGNFRYFNARLHEGNIEQNRQKPEYRKLRHDYLTGLDKKLARERQADHCIGCGICVDSCPQQIDIPAQLRRIDHYVESLREDVL